MQHGFLFTILCVRAVYGYAVPGIIVGHLNVAIEDCAKSNTACTDGRPTLVYYNAKTPP